MTKSSVFRGVTLFRPTGKWRAQISSGGKTISLGDHDSEEEAARAFDRASLNKMGYAAKTNYPLQEYEPEMDELMAMSQGHLVAMLRERARRPGVAASRFRGVIALPGNRWAAQINVEGRLLSVGVYDSEIMAATEFDRACILRHLGTGGPLQLNLPLTDYSDWLKRCSSMDIADYFAKLPTADPAPSPPTTTNGLKPSSSPSPAVAATSDKSDRSAMALPGPGDADDSDQAEGGAGSDRLRMSSPMSDRGAHGGQGMSDSDTGAGGDGPRGKRSMGLIGRKRSPGEEPRDWRLESNRRAKSRPHRAALEDLSPSGTFF